MERMPYRCKSCSYNKIFYVLKVEIENEIKAIMYYKNMLRITDMPEDKKIIISIIKSKEEHLKNLQLLYIQKVTGKAFNEEADRQVREFTLEELEKYDGSNGKPAYVAIEGSVYDVSNSAEWGGGTHFGLYAGKDLTLQFKACHENNNILDKLKKVGTVVKA